MKLLHGVRVIIPRQQNDSTAFIPTNALAIVGDTNAVLHIQYIGDEVMDVRPLQGGMTISAMTLVNMLSLYQHMQPGCIVVVYGDGTPGSTVVPHALAVGPTESLCCVLDSDVDSVEFTRNASFRNSFDVGQMTIEVVERRDYSITLRLRNSLEQVLYLDILHGQVESLNLGPTFNAFLGHA
jgi:hypothetical protein